MDARRRRGRRKERTDNQPQDQKPLFFRKAPLRGEGCAARCLLAECLWSSCRQAGRTSWSRTLQAACGVHPLPGGRQQLAQGARQTDGRLRLTASSTSKAAGSSTDQRQRKAPPARRRRGRRKERTGTSKMGKNVENSQFSPGSSAPRPPAPELATLTATIMHARSGPPVDVQGRPRGVTSLGFGSFLFP